MTCIDIKNLSGRYFKGNESKKVLYIEELAIESNEFYFILGPSGIGKSTLLEILGLMNNPFDQKSSSVTFNFSGGKKNLVDLWKDEDEISKFRKQNMAFIFQDNDLMPNFTMMENLCLAVMINGNTYDQAKEKVIPYWKKLDLPIEKINDAVMNFSGGQQQRVAFLRALVSDYSILFGDEPTGNLDIVNARAAMRLLKDELELKNKTAVIVSHDIKIALEFATRIICLIEVENIGTTKKDFIFAKHTETGIWENLLGDQFTKDELFEILNSTLIQQKDEVRTFVH